MSATTNTEKTSITLTLEPEQKQLLEKAAALRCLTVSEYLLQLALDIATEEIQEPEVIAVSDGAAELITEGENLAESDFADYLSNLEEYEERLARAEIQW